MTRTTLLLASIVGGVVLLFFVGGLPGQTGAASKPNIVFILTDDQAESTFSYMPYVQSLIKKEGRTFDNAFNVYPLCCPSRAIIQRGQYAHNTGVFGNGPDFFGNDGGYPAFDRLDREKSTVATWLDTAGYRTIHFGKYMNGFDHQVDPKPPGWVVFDLPTTSYQRGETKTATYANKALAQLRQDVPKIEPVFCRWALPPRTCPTAMSHNTPRCSSGSGYRGFRVSMSKTSPTSLAT